MLLKVLSCVIMAEYLKVTLETQILIQNKNIARKNTLVCGEESTYEFWLQELRLACNDLFPVTCCFTSMTYIKVDYYDIPLYLCILWTEPTNVLE